MIKLLGLNLDFSIAKARRELGYEPVISRDAAIDAMADITIGLRVQVQS